MQYNDMDRLIHLEQMPDFKVAEGDPDVRGWDVISSDRQKIGEVDHLLVDRQAMKVRYLDVALDRDFPDRSKRRHVLIPIGAAQLDQRGKQIYVDDLSSTAALALPEYRQDAVTRDYEASLGRHFDQRSAGAALVGDFYGSDLYDDNRFYGARGGDRENHEERITLSEEELVIGKRPVEAGAVEIDKRVETEQVRETVPVMRDEVTVERRPVDAGAPVEARFEEDEVRIPLTAEELVVDKRAAAKEELVVKKRQVQRETVVEADLRKERADVHTESDVQRAADAKNRDWF